jgi:Flp pilus assembly protein TadG
MVEFAIVAPLGLLLMFGIVIFGLLEMNQVALSNLTRDSVRAGGVCGSAQRATNSKLPDGNACSYANLKTYVSSRLNGLPSGSVVKPPTGSFSSTNCDTTASNAIYCVWDPSHNAVAISGSNPLDACIKGDELEIVTEFNQSLYTPFVGKAFGGSGTNKTLSADAYAACEQALS